MYALVGLLFLFSIVRWLMAQRASPGRQQRKAAIAALCEKRGLVPGPVRLAGTFLIATFMDAPAFENSFSSPDGEVSAADYWRRQGKGEWHAFSLLVFTIEGLNMPYVAVTRRNLPGLPLIWGPQQVELESIDFTAAFLVRAADRRSAVMLLDEGMMQWMLDCQDVSFEMGGDRIAALVWRRDEPTNQPALPSASNPRQADPVEMELLFKFQDGFVTRVPAQVRSEYPAAV